MEEKNMKLIRRSENLNPFAPYFFDDFLGWGSTDWSGKNGNFLPAVNIRETDDNFEVELAVPGFGKNDFKIELDQDILTVSSEKNNGKENKDEKSNFYKKEFSYHSFERSFKLPEGAVNSDKINANYKDGVLKIEIPKKEELKPKPLRQISVS